MDNQKIPETMKALVKTKQGPGYELKELSVPEPGPNQVLIRSGSVGLCGSDIFMYNWVEFIRSMVTAIPFTPGHEMAGTVVKVGERVHLKVGDRVAVENHYGCGTCYPCLHDRGDICREMTKFGHGMGTPYGGCSQYTIVPEKFCYKLQSNISLEEAALLEPLGVAHNALEQCEVENEEVLIIGCGPIGLLACSVAKVMGATRVYAVDINPLRLKLAKTMGADVVINNEKEDLHELLMTATSGEGIGRICEVSGSEKMINSMFSLLRQGGMISMIGIPVAPIHLDNPLHDIIQKSLTLRTIFGRRIFHSWEACEQLVATEQVDVQPLITHRYPLTRFKEAFDALLAKTDACKILIDPQE